MREKNRQTEILKDRKTERRLERETDREIDRQTERLKERKRKTVSDISLYLTPLYGMKGPCALLYHNHRDNDDDFYK